jgi:hypothetical protein
MDEVNWISQSRIDRFTNTIEMGRPSQLIMALTNFLVQFEKPFFINMIPRFLAVVLMFYALYRFSISCGLNYSMAIGYVCFFALSHQLDWQHNGLVAFFSIFCLYIGCFLLAVNNDLWTSKLSILRICLYLISFGNELFIILSFILIFINFQLKRNFHDLKELIVSLIVISLLYFYYFNFIKIPPETHEYLLGSFGIYSITELIYSGLLYFIYSVPLLNFLFLDSLLENLIIFFVLIFILYFFYVYIKCEKNTNVHKYQLILFFFLAAALPQFLMSAQPMKVNWILTDASHRYAFSLYGWMFISFAIFYVSIYWIRRAGVIIRIFLILLLSAFIITSLYFNIQFVKEYKNSMENWKTLHNLAKRSKDSVQIPLLFLNHPYILPVTQDHVRNIIMNAYGVQSVFVSENIYTADFNNGIKFSNHGLPSFVKEVKGLSVTENFGRWSDSNLNEYVEIVFADPLPKNFILKVGVIPFGQNIDNYVSIKIGDEVRNMLVSFSNNQVVDLAIPFLNINSDTIIFIPHYPISPAAIDIKSNDKRKIALAFIYLQIIDN